jgi:hypothetical protein
MQKLAEDLRDFAISKECHSAALRKNVVGLNVKKPALVGYHRAPTEVSPDRVNIAGLV